MAFLLPEGDAAPLWSRFQTAFHALVKRSHPTRPLVLVVDDAQDLDDTTAALIHHATTRDVVAPILTARGDRTLPEPIERLRQEGRLERIDLDDLDRVTTEELLDAVLRPGTPLTVRNRIWELSLGNPLLVRELVLGGIDPLDLELAPERLDRLLDVVSHRLGELDEDQRAALEIVAVAGPVEIDLLEPWPGASTVADLERRALLAVDRDERRSIVRFAHPLHGEVLHAGMARSRVRERSKLMAQRLRATGLRRKGDLVRAASLHLEGGEDLDPDLLRGAAEEALGSFAYGTAERLARAAWTAAHDPRALLVIGQVLLRTGRGEEAADTFAEVMRVATEEAAHLDGLLGRVHALAFALGRVSEAHALAQDALRSSPTGPQALAVRIASAWAAAIGGSFEEAIEVGRQVTDDGTVPVELRLRASTISTLGLVMVGLADEADEKIASALELAASTETDPTLVHLFETNRLMGMVYRGALREAEDLASTRHEEAAAAGGQEIVALWATNLAFVRERAGRYPTAVALLEGAATIADRFDPFGIRGLIAGLGATAAAQMNDRRSFERFASRLVARSPEDRRTQVIEDRVEVWRRVLAGDLDGAAVHAAERARFAIAHDHTNWAIMTVYDAVRLGRGDLVADLLAEVAATTDGALVPLLARHAEATAAGEGAELESIANTLSSMGFQAFAMEALAQAARALERMGAHEASRRATARLATMKEALPGVRTPAVTSARAPRLTRREAQIARLAIHHTSREIADKLGISVRTVDNHLANVYTKLGIHGRRELAEALGIEHAEAE